MEDEGQVVRNSLPHEHEICHRYGSTGRTATSAQAQSRWPRSRPMTDPLLEPTQRPLAREVVESMAAADDQTRSDDGMMGDRHSEKRVEKCASAK